MIDPETESSVRAAWGARPHLTDDALRRGVRLFPPAEPWVVSPSGLDLVPPTRGIREHFFRLVDDEVYQPDGKHPYLLHRRLRIIGDGVTVEEQVEPTINALRRGRYHQIQPKG